MKNMPKNIQNILAEQKKIDKKVEALHGGTWRRFEKLLKTLFHEYKNLDIIVFRGHTPTFNDGDVCEHYGDIFIEPGDVSDYYEDDEDKDEDDEGRAEEDSSKNSDEVDAEYIPNGNLTEKELEHIQECMELFEPAIEREYTTNYLVVIRRSKDGFKLTHDDFDPPY